MRSAFRSSRHRLAVLGLFCALSLAFGGGASAQDLREDGSAIIYTEVIIPDATPPSQTLDKRAEYFAEGKVVDLAQYLGIIYNFLISIAGLVASVMIIIGGVQYLTSAGDASKIGAAKSRMTNAFMGLILVLGAYTILKTVNPALVVLKMPGVKDVKTETTSMQWCDEVAASGTKVNPIWGDPGTCGSVGEFMNGKSRLACLYRSVCPNFETSDVPTVPKSASKLQSICIQTLTTSAYTSEPWSSDQVLAFVDRSSIEAKTKTTLPTFGDDAARKKWIEENRYPPGEPRPASDISGKVGNFAQCKSCVEYGPGEAAPAPNSNRQVTSEGRCQYWQNQANRGVGFGSDAWKKRREAGKPLLSYCFWIPDEGGCAAADFSCEEPTDTASCENYNKIWPFYLFSSKLGGYRAWSYGILKMGSLSARPDALQNVCFANPCGYHMNISEDEIAAGRAFNFTPSPGCTGSGGIVDGIRTIAAAVRDGVSGIQECVNK